MEGKHDFDSIGNAILSAFLSEQITFCLVSSPKKNRTVRKVDGCAVQETARARSLLFAPVRTLSLIFHAVVSFVFSCHRGNRSSSFLRDASDGSLSADLHWDKPRSLRWKGEDGSLFYWAENVVISLSFFLNQCFNVHSISRCIVRKRWCCDDETEPIHKFFHHESIASRYESWREWTTDPLPCCPIAIVLAA